MSNTGGPCCACLSVSYTPIDLAGPGSWRREQWTCNSCGFVFVKRIFLDRAQADSDRWERLAGEASEHVTALVDGVDGLQLRAESAEAELALLRGQRDGTDGGTMYGLTREDWANVNTALSQQPSMKSAEAKLAVYREYVTETDPHDHHTCGCQDDDDCNDRIVEARVRLSDALAKLNSTGAK